MIIDFTIGYPEGTMSFTGTLLILHIAYSISSFISLFMIFFAIERKMEKKTHYLLSILVVITAIITIINFLLPHEISSPFFTFAFVYPFWLLTILSLPTLYISVAIHSEGTVRKNALIAAAGMVAFEFGIAINSPEAYPVFEALGPDLILIIPPILTVIGATLVYIALRLKT